MEKGFFGSLFDLNEDGELELGEQYMDYMAFEEVTKEDNLQLSGLDSDELFLMDEDERIEALEDAGLDPEDYGFY